MDEGSSNFVMSTACWKAINRQTLSKSSSTLQELHGHHFIPHRIQPRFSIGLGGMTAYVDVEVINSPLDFNFFLGRTWFYAMFFVVSSLLHVLHFPHEVNIVRIYQLEYFLPLTKTVTKHTYV